MAHYKPLTAVIETVQQNQAETNGMYVNNCRYVKFDGHFLDGYKLLQKVILYVYEFRLGGWMWSAV